MRQRQVQAGDLIRLRVVTTDRGRAAVRDLNIDPGGRAVPCGAVEAGAWAPGHDGLVGAGYPAEVDEFAGEVNVDVRLKQVRNSPTLAWEAP